MDPQTPAKDGRAEVIQGSEIRVRRQEVPLSCRYGFERYGYRKGLLLGIEACLEVKFGAAGLELMPEIHEIWDNEVLLNTLHRIPTAESPAALRRYWTRIRRRKKVDPIYGLIDDPRPPDGATRAPRR